MVRHPSDAGAAVTPRGDRPCDEAHMHAAEEFLHTPGGGVHAPPFPGTPMGCQEPGVPILARSYIHGPKPPLDRARNNLACSYAMAASLVGLNPRRSPCARNAHGARELGPPGNLVVEHEGGSGGVETLKMRLCKEIVLRQSDLQEPHPNLGVDYNPLASRWTLKSSGRAGVELLSTRPSRGPTLKTMSPCESDDIALREGKRISVISTCHVS